MTRHTPQLVTTLLTALMVAAQCIVPSIGGCACAAEASASVDAATPKSCCSTSDSKSSCGACGTSECTCGDDCGQKQTGCECGCNDQKPASDPVQESESPTESQVKVLARNHAEDATSSVPAIASTGLRSRPSSDLIPSSSVQVLLCTWRT